MLCKYPNMINLETDLKKYRQYFFFSHSEYGIEELYRIDYDDIDDIYTPQKISSLPLLRYEDEVKMEWIKKFLADREIAYILSDKNIVVLDKDYFESKDIVAPIYEKKGNYFVKKGNSYSGKVYTKKTIDKACDIFLKYRKAIKAEEILFDFKELSLDNGISAYLERYPLSPALYLDKSRYYVMELNGDPNTEDVYNKYTNTYLIQKTKENGFASGGSYIVFDKVKIDEKLHNGDVECTFPSRELASIIIGKGGEGIKELSFKLGVKRLIIDTPNQPKRQVV